MRLTLKWLAFILLALVIGLWFVFHPKPANSHADEIEPERGIMDNSIILVAHTPEKEETPVKNDSMPSGGLLTHDSLLDRIEMCESGGNPLARNPNSTAKGLFQFINSSWSHYGRELWGEDLDEKDVFDAKDNRELADYVLTKYGVSPWLESRSCWS